METTPLIISEELLLTPLDTIRGVPGKFSELLDTMTNPSEYISEKLLTTSPMCSLTPLI
jgi:hypothetical protein